MTSPLVTVIVPVFNRERFIGDALESIQAQDYEPIETIVVDDGSTDGSFEIADSYPGVTCLRQDNAGPAVARNAALKTAHGELISFLDSDDVLLPNKISAQVEFLMSHPDVGAVLCRQRIEVDAGLDVPDWVRELATGVGDEREPLQAVFTNRAQALSVMVRAEVLAKVGWFDPGYTMGEDYDLLMRIDEADRLELMPETLMIRRVHGSNMSLENDLLVQSRAVVFQLLKARLSRRRSPR